MRRRPQTLTSALAYLVRLYAARASARQWAAVGLLATTCVVFGVWVGAAEERAHDAALSPPAADMALSPACRALRKPLRVATYNIENFPQSQAQVIGAFALIEQTKAPIIGVQEITDAARFEAEARARLGSAWRFAYIPESKGADAAADAYTGTDAEVTAPNRPRQLQGVLYDSGRYTLRATTRHDDTRTDPHGRPTLEAHLVPVGWCAGPAARVLVVHLRAGSEGQPTRALQYKALRAIVERVTAHGDPVVLLGDFNATEQADLADLADLAQATSLRWTTQAVPCTAFWRRDKDCPSSRLDHILSSQRAAEVVAIGACRSHGCKTQDRCPADSYTISDHCPVIATFSP
jgi:endonuclease/exonuclease/phosphatase family metal-dependent hydrolase